MAQTIGVGAAGGREALPLRRARTPRRGTDRSAASLFSECALAREARRRSSCIEAIDGEDPERTWFRVIEFARLQRFDGLLKRIEEAMTVDRNFGR